MLTLEHRAGIAGDVGKLAVANAPEEGMFLWDEVNEAAVEDEDVAPAVVVEVVDAGSPADVLRGGLGDARLRGYVVKAVSLPALRRRRLNWQSVTQRSSLPSPSTSTKTGPMEEVDSPFWP